MSKINNETLKAIPKKIRNKAVSAKPSEPITKGLGTDIFNTAVKQAGVMREKLLALAKHNNATLENTITELKQARDEYVALHCGVKPSAKGELSSLDSFKVQYPDATQAQIKVVGGTVNSIRQRVSEYILIIETIRGGVADSLAQAPSYQAMLSVARQLKGSTRKTPKPEAKVKEHLTDAELDRIMKLLDEANRLELNRIIEKATQALKAKTI